jgi:hypothetical protein
LNGFKDATLDESRIREWWKRWPDANVAIATGPSGLCVVDIDHGIDNYAKLADFMSSKGLTHTRAVRTGRRDGYGVQLYYEGEGLKSVPWKDGEVSGDIRCATGYVMAAGSIHPDSGEPYTVLYDASSLPSVPAYVRTLKPERGAGVPDDGAPITESRNNALTSIAGKLRNAGLSASALEVALLQVNADRCVPPLPEEEVQRIAGNASKWELREEGPEVTLGCTVAASEVQEGKLPQFMTLEDFDSVKPPAFLVDGFLVREAMAMLAGPVAQRKTLVALNLTHALCTGEPLFGHFEVVHKPRRIYYLCPEMGASSFCKRLNSLGLREYIGTTLFCLTLNQPPIELEALDDIAGSVVIVDTLTRFVKGNENDSTDMREFAARVMAMNRAGATVVLLHHSKKGSSGTLDDGLRGSSELAAFVTSCWVTGLQDIYDPYKSLSEMRNVKQRDFESEEFTIRPVPDSCSLVWNGTPEPKAEVSKKRKQAASEKAESAAAEIFKATPGISAKALRIELGKAGHRKGSDWVTETLVRLLGGGVTVTPE